MRRSPLPGVDPRPYLGAAAVLVKNPVIIVVPLLIAVIGVVLRIVVTPYADPVAGGMGAITSGLMGFIVALLQIFGLGSACIMADMAWRRGRTRFDEGWLETQRKGGDLLYTAIGITLLFSVGSYLASFVGVVGIVVMALIAFGLIWAVPAAAIGGIPGGAAIGVSVERVRAAPLAAGVLAAATILVGMFVPLTLGPVVLGLLGTLAASIAVQLLIPAVIQSICIGYIACVMAKTYADTAFGRHW